MWCVIINHAIPVDINIIALLKRDDGRKAVFTLESVADLVGAIATGADNVVIQHITEISGEGIKCGVIQTNAKTAQLNISAVEGGAGIHAIAEVKARFGKGRKRAEFGFRSRRCA